MSRDNSWTVGPARPAMPAMPIRPAFTLSVGYILGGDDLARGFSRLLLQATSEKPLRLLHPASPAPPTPPPPPPPPALPTPPAPPRQVIQLLRLLQPQTQQTQLKQQKRAFFAHDEGEDKPKKRLKTLSEAGSIVVPRVLCAVCRQGYPSERGYCDLCCFRL